jgi:4-amino-4-deoxy-L-arabinose transferase-like glycosyltransferase
LCLVPSLPIRHLWGPDESRYAEVARQILVRHDWTTPWLNGLPYLDKPPLFYWVAAVFFKCFGVSDFVARLGPALFSLLALFAVYGIGSLWFDRRTGLLAALMLLSSILFLSLSGVVILDMELTSLVTLALFAFSLGHRRDRRWYLAMYGLMALAFLSKGPVGLGIPAGAVAIAVLLHRRRTPWVTLYPVWGPLLFLGVALPWYIAVTRQHGTAYLEHFFLRENLHSLRNPTIHHKQQPFVFLLFVFGGFAPWTPLALHGAWMLVRQWKVRSEESRMAFTLMGAWFAIPFLVFGLSASQLGTYFLPCMAPLALLAADYARTRLARRPGEEGGSDAVMWSGLGVSVLAAAGLAGVVLWSGAPSSSRSHEASDFALAAPWIRMAAGVYVVVLAATACLIFLRRPLAGVVGATLGSGVVLLLANLALRSAESFYSPASLWSRAALGPGDRVIVYKVPSAGTNFYTRRDEVTVVGITQDHETAYAFGPRPDLYPERKGAGGRSPDEVLREVTHEGGPFYLIAPARESRRAGFLEALGPDRVEVATDGGFTLWKSGPGGASR